MVSDLVSKRVTRLHNVSSTVNIVLGTLPGKASERDDEDCSSRHRMRAAADQPSRSRPHLRHAARSPAQQQHQVTTHHSAKAPSLTCS